ncbi:hypothetical protein MPH_03133 [Macrophomina phaseolina MS6]|uniref:Luciferase domain-containing protein n=1 Tax=Macrophomina phaseolina (strain MS6) TaxID=1126212 RepID=K2SRD8_MACPH|nr:hypothetical protein MPH_03133 [Macrophomina phaseolina MS6]
MTLQTVFPPSILPASSSSSFSFSSTPGPLSLLALLILLPPTIYFIHRDYQSFLSLGAGGTPQNLTGYLRIKLLSLFALPNTRIPAPIPADLRQNGYLTSLPPRAGPRPTVAGIAPHRQTSQRSPSPSTPYTSLVARIQALAQKPLNSLVEGTSCFEKHGTGLFSLRPLTRTCRGEVCHVHGSDGSLHMTLYPADAKLVIERGWGERHPIARGGFFARFVPKHFVMVYAPRDEDEVETVMRIVGAAVWWVSGECVGKDEGVMRDGRARSESDEKVVEVVRESDGDPEWVGKHMPERFCLGCRQKQYGRMQQACTS